MAVDAEGDALRFNRNSWSPPTSIEPVKSDGLLASLSCISSKFCVAVNYSGKVLMYDGTRWSKGTSIDSANHLASVSCASPIFCATVDQAGGALSYNGKRWSGRQSPDPPFGEPDSVSCTSSTFCAAVDKSGNILTFDGKEWSAPLSLESTSNRGLDALSCISPTFCMAVDYYGRAPLLQRQEVDRSEVD